MKGSEIETAQINSGKLLLTVRSTRMLFSLGGFLHGLEFTCSLERLIKYA